MKEKKDKFEKKLIFFDESKFNGLLSELEICKSLITGIISEICDLTKKPDNVDLPDVSMLLHSNYEYSVKVIKEFIFDIISENNSPALFGIPIDKEKAIEMVNLPDITRLKALLTEYQRVTTNFSVGAKFFTVTNGIVNLKPETIDYLKNSCTLYAETEPEIKRFEYCSQIAELLNKISTENLAVNFDSDFTLDAIFQRRSKSAKSFMLNYQFVKRGDLLDANRRFLRVGL